jgi:hypothetical protein
MFKDRATKFVRSTAIGITAIWISNNYTHPAIEKWRGRDGSNPKTEDQTTQTTPKPKPQEPKLVYHHGTWPPA